MKTIEEKNRMIAEFMDVPTESTIVNFAQPDGYTRAKTVIAYQIEPKRIDGFPNLTFDFQLKYHTSWDWLMPVIGEVKYSAGESDEITDVLDRIDSGLLGRNIEYTFNSVVEFIEWYNENK